MNRKIVFGLTLMMSSVWGGSYLSHIVGSTWAEKPIVFTTALIFFCGFWGVVSELELNRTTDHEVGEQ
jgi:hypothetical protein